MSTVEPSTTPQPSCAGARFGPAAIRAALAAAMMLDFLAGRQGRAHASRWFEA